MDGRARREAALRRRFALAMVVSVAGHAALFALPGFEIPLLPEAREGRGRLAAIRPPSREAEPPLRVVEYVIRPPGVASAGGASSASSPADLRAETPRAARGAPVAAPAPVDVVTAARAPTAPAFASRLHTTPAEARSALALPVMAGAPPRGVPEGAAGGAAGKDGSGSGSASGEGARGTEGTGVTVFGSGDNCITPYLPATRTGDAGLEGRLAPGRAGSFEPGGRSGGFPRRGPGGSGGRFRP